MNPFKALRNIFQTIKDNKQIEKSLNKIASEDGGMKQSMYKHTISFTENGAQTRNYLLFNGFTYSKELRQWTLNYDGMYLHVTDEQILTKELSEIKEGYYRWLRTCFNLPEEKAKELAGYGKEEAN